MVAARHGHFGGSRLVIEPTRPSTLRSVPRVLLGGLRLELEAHERLVADDLRVVARLYHVGVAGADVDDGSVLVRDAHTARLRDAEVPELAAVSSDDGLDARGPGPSGLHRQSRSRLAAEMDDVDLCLFGRPTLVG